MIQGGGMDENFKEKATRDAIENEADNGLSNDLGTIAMARTQAPHSASAQFFINVKTTLSLTTLVKLHKVGVMQYLVKLLKVWML
jgi:peptidyl-prolyl cis-trans isomerase B (cyclophilin B)